MYVSISEVYASIIISQYQSESDLLMTSPIMESLVNTYTRHIAAFH